MKSKAALILAAAISFVCLATSDQGIQPCCGTCEHPQVKFYSIPHPESANAECGECCLDPKKLKFWKLFEPKLLKGGCASEGFTKYKSTESDGVWPLTVSNDRYVRQVANKFCPDKLQAIYADMHDGDKKEVMISGTSLTIKPSGNNQTWVVQSEVDTKSCSASINFNVPGKPGPPPVNLLATLMWTVSTAGKRTEFEFTDPSGTLAPKALPLNRWVELGKDSTMPCPKSLNAIYADMHDGDKKAVVILGTSMTIKSSGTNQTWVVKSDFDTKSCSAMVDFNVPGKPSPPPVNVKLSLSYTFTAMMKKTEFQFTDPSGTLASPDFPLNRWVEVSSEKADRDIVV